MHFSSHVYTGWVGLELSSTAHKEEIKHKWWKQLNWKLLQSEADDDYYSKIELSSDWSRNISSNINLILKKSVAFAIVIVLNRVIQLNCQMLLSFFSLIKKRSISILVANEKNKWTFTLLLFILTHINILGKDTGNRCSIWSKRAKIIKFKNVRSLVFGS